jgi:hypothetical protein
VKLLLAILLIAAPAGAQRTYWTVPLDSLAIGRHKHTHAAVTGKVAYVVHESDGDIHIKLVSPSGRFIIAECIPLLPCVPPKAGQTVTIKGITRQDPEHMWFELHPVEGIQ